MRKLILPFLLFIAFAVYAQNEAPVNQDFSNYLNLKNLGLINKYTNDGHPLGEIPSINNFSFDALADKPYNQVKSLPSSFDLRSQGGTTPVGNQIASGPCWAFGSIGSIESYLKYQSIGIYDFSEINLSTCHGYEWAPCDGGNFDLAMSYASRLTSIVLENADPYPGTESAICNATCTSYTPQFWMSNIVELPGIDDPGYDANIVKQAVYDNGAVYCNMFYDDVAYSGAPNYTHYYTGAEGTNHGVLIVGWDDNKVVSGAPGNGAWIIKNSWGTGWGESGYFYISYYDTEALTSVGYFTDAVEYDSNSQLYHYDEIGSVSGVGYNDNDAYGLVKFTASSDQQITKISTFVRSAGATISIEVYDDFTGGILSNLLGSLNNQAVTYPGFYTFDLSSAININTSDDFYVKVFYNTPGTIYPVPIEKVSAGYANPSIESNVCWYSNSGSSWTEAGAAGRDVCIRAYAVPQITYNVTFNVTDGSNPIENATVTFDGTPQWTNTLGTTVFTNISDGTYAYSVTKSGYQDDNGNATVSGGDVIKNITLSQSTYNVTFNVKDNLANPVENAEVVFDGSSQFTNASGTTVFLSYTNGTYNYTVSKTGYQNDNGNVTINGNHVQKNITLLEDNFDVTFNVSDGTNPIENAEVIFNSLTQHTNASGETVFTDVPVGTGLPYSVTFTGYDIVNNTLNVVNQDVVENVIMGETLPTTKLTDTYCGTSISSSSTYITCDVVSGASDYQYNFVHTGTGYDETVTRGMGTTVLPLSMVPNYVVGRTYEVKVKAYVGGVWGDYGDVCNLTITGTKLRDTYCGLTIPSSSYYILCDEVPGATDYQYNFVHLGSGYDETVTRGLGTTVLPLSMVPNYIVGRTYDVKVKAFKDGVWSDYGEICQLTIGGTKLRDAYCDQIIPSSSYYILCDAVSGATDYQYNFVHAGTSYDETVNRGLGTTVLPLSLVPNFTSGLTYEVRVKAFKNGVWSDYGQMCTLTRSGSKSYMMDTEWEMLSEVKSLLYPNPFSNNSNFIITGESDMDFNIYISDITGKIVYEDIINSNNEYELGGDLEQGVYMLIIFGNNNDFKENIKFIKQ